MQCDPFEGLRNFNRPNEPRLTGRYDCCLTGRKSVATHVASSEMKLVLTSSWRHTCYGKSLWHSYSPGHVSLYSKAKPNYFSPLLHELVNYSDFAGCQVENSLANVVNKRISKFCIGTSSNFLTVMLAVWLKHFEVSGVTNGREINT